MVKWNKIRQFKVLPEGHITNKPAVSRLCKSCELIDTVLDIGGGGGEKRNLIKNIVKNMGFNLKTNKNENIFNTLF